MLKKLILSLLVTTAMCTSANAAAAPTTQTASGKIDQKTWDSYSKQQKLQWVEQRHQASIEKANEKWKGMTDDQKIAQYEKRRARFAAMKNNHQNTASGATSPAPQAAAATSATPAR